MVSHVQDIDRGYADMLRTLRSTTGVQVRVGVRSDGRDPDVAQIAEWQEFGTADGHVPERSFLRATVDERRALIANLMIGALKKVIFQRAKPQNAYAQVGKRVVFEIQRKISSGIAPPNAPSTLARKRGTTPLIDTGHLHRSIDYEVVIHEQRTGQPPQVAPDSGSRRSRALRSGWSAPSPSGPGKGLPATGAPGEEDLPVERGDLDDRP